MIVKELETALQEFETNYTLVYKNKKLSYTDKYIKKMELTLEFAKLTKKKINSFDSFIKYLDKCFDKIEMVHSGKVFTWDERMDFINQCKNEQ
jgi:hypothetical protein